MAQVRRAVVVDTDVFSARLVPNSTLARGYESTLAGRREVISFQTAAEVRYGAELRGWGGARLAQMEATLGRVRIEYPGPDLVRAYAELRAACQRVGHALS